MDRAQAEFLSGVRRHIHDHIVGRYDAHYALTDSGWEGKKTLGVGVLIDRMEDRLFEPGTLRVKTRLGAPMGGQLRGARMKDPRHQLEGQEVTLSRADQEQLMDLAALMRGVAGESKAWLGAFLESDGSSLRKDELKRLKTALDWLKVAEAAFKSIPMQIELVRERRAPTGRRRAEAAHEHGYTPAEREMLEANVIDDDTDEPVKKLTDDGDVFNDFMAGLGAIRQGWFKMAAAMCFSPAPPPEAEIEEALSEEGLVYEGDGQVRAMSESQATPNARARKNHESFGWPRAAWE